MDGGPYFTPHPENFLSTLLSLTHRVYYSGISPYDAYGALIFLLQDGASPAVRSVGRGTHRPCRCSEPAHNSCSTNVFA